MAAAMAGPTTFLVDNGSLEPAATLRLRELAHRLADRIGVPVRPVSLLHASAVTAGQLGGVPAEIVEPTLARLAADGAREFVIVPLFFGPSRALTDYLPARVAHLRARFPDLRVRVAPCLHHAGDDRLARILADHVRAAGTAPRVVLVDHGSPAAAVTEVRNQLADRLASELGPERRVAPASMERREGADYDFCEPLLERKLREPGWNDGEVIVAMQFLLPGRHAGPEGDVAGICRRAEADCPGLRTRMTALVGEHPLLVDILADRWRAAVQAPTG
jgi:sirohydrochlorin ferrochelatase